jgi:alanine racemase
MSSPETAGALLTIDLDAVAANWRLLQGRTEGALTAAVVKADAYGLGAERIAPVLAAAGCEVFFVALVNEGIALRAVLPGAEIHVLGGILPGSEEALAEHRLIPALNSLGDIERWSNFTTRRGAALLADLHIDTGMSRLGLDERELATVISDPGLLGGISLSIVLSHLACADDPDHPLNRQQLDAYRRALKSLPRARSSLANSSGIFLGPGFHFDLVRPGAALYGISPVTGDKKSRNPMAQTVRLEGKILQVRDVDTPKTVGYGASYQVTAPARIATVAVGYADGYARSLSNTGGAYFGDIRAPVVGRVSMDLITLDVSHVPRRLVHPGAAADLIGSHYTVDDMARDAGTIGYEILTRLGGRYHRSYTGGGAA